MGRINAMKRASGVIQACDFLHGVVTVKMLKSGVGVGPRRTLQSAACRGIATKRPFARISPSRVSQAQSNLCDGASSACYGRVDARARGPASQDSRYNSSAASASIGFEIRNPCT